MERFKGGVANGGPGGVADGGGGVADGARGVAEERLEDFMVIFYLAVVIQETPFNTISLESS